VAPRTYDVQRIDGLPPAQVTPPPEALKRIAEDVQQTRAARGRDTARTDFARGFTWPCQGPISGVYGSQRILNGQPKQPHYGVDVAAPVGTKVRAPAGGIVSLAVPDMYYTGGTLMIDHGHGLTSTMMHLSKVLAKVGQEVKQGDVVAEVGATGRVTGPHLDWRISWFDSRVDPQRLVGPMPEKRD
jgi:murein DD-endopeptidase MepM/ murein hydrolase activator NlpD